VQFFYGKKIVNFLWRQKSKSESLKKTENFTKEIFFNYQLKRINFECRNCYSCVVIGVWTPIRPILCVIQMVFTILSVYQKRTSETRAFFFLRTSETRVNVHFSRLEYIKTKKLVSCILGLIAQRN